MNNPSQLNLFATKKERKEFLVFYSTMLPSTHEASWMEYFVRCFVRCFVRWEWKHEYLLRNKLKLEKLLRIWISGLDCNEIEVIDRKVVNVNLWSKSVPRWWWRTSARQEKAFFCENGKEMVKLEGQSYI